VKRNKIFRVLALTGILSLLVVALPASPALAAEKLTIDPEEGEIGDSIEIEGKDFTEKESVGDPPTQVHKDVTLYFTSEEVEVGDDVDDLDVYEIVDRTVEVDDGDDDFKVDVEVPSRLTDGDDTEDVQGGTYYFFATYKGEDNYIEAVAEFTVIMSVIELDSDEGKVDTEVEITGTDFSSREDIEVEYDGDEIPIESGDTKTDSDGEFTCTVIIPESTAGDHTIVVIDADGREGSATFTVEPEIALDPASAAPGAEVTVAGTGFGDKSDVTISLDTSTVANVETTSDGSFEGTFTVPATASGSYTVKAKDEDNNQATADLTIAANITVNPITTLAAAGNVGQNITVRGAGFEPQQVITVTYATTPIVVATVNSDANGIFTAVFEAPPSEAGEHTISASDGINTVSVAFYMEAVAPTTPVPLLPEMGIKAERPVHFDWEDVADDSLPVTYTLEIATDENFSVTSLVLKKEGLTESGYTLTEAEKLDSRKKETPYYWRVKAIDSASNVSGWSGTGTFYTSRFNLPPWMIHVWWGLGAMGAGLGGYWLGKKRAYYYY